MSFDLFSAKMNALCKNHLSSLSLIIEKKNMTLFSKIKWIAAILLVFLIVLITNLIDRDHYKKLSYAVTTMYEDRLVAKDLLFDMSSIIQKKKMAAVTLDTAFYKVSNDVLDTELDHLMVEYNITKLTNKEKVAFKLLQKDVASLREKERNLSSSNKAQIIQHIEDLEKHLYTLSKIQVQEGRRQLSISQSSKDSLNLFTQVEVIFLIVTAVLIQVIIFYKPKSTAE
jgi:hypothetical protein